MKMLTLLLVLAMPALAYAQTCRVATTSQSGATVPLLVELYTSEGCSSCPPADRWLSGLKGQPGVITAAFHVDYWNGLGWPDRFSSPAYTERQKQGVGVNGSRYAYTPQLVVMKLLKWHGTKGRDCPCLNSSTGVLTELFPALKQSR